MCLKFSSILPGLYWNLTVRTLSGADINLAVPRNNCVLGAVYYVIAFAMMLISFHCFTHR